MGCAMASFTDTGLHASLLHICCLAIFLNLLFSAWCFKRRVQFNVLEKTKLFSLNQQELNFDQLQGSAHVQWAKMAGQSSSCRELRTIKSTTHAQRKTSKN